METFPKKQTTLAIHWSSFGAFHLARLKTSFEELAKQEILVVGMEISTRKNLFGWDPNEGKTPFPRHVVFPGLIYEKIPPITMWQGVFKALDKINPDAVAINGYSYYDAISALMWCKVRHRPAILMSDSKIDDFQRSLWKESIKRFILTQYDSALCAGGRSRKYLVDLGMDPDKIFFGLDAVDNTYFRNESEKARQQPDRSCSLPGLERPEPFFLASSRFVKRKNLDGLIRAYGNYRKQVLGIQPDLSPWRLVILGDGEERDALKNIVQSENISGITFAGYCQINDLPMYYGLASVFIHPAHQDQWALVVNEAMASGLPVLVSNRAGCAQDLVHDGQNGYQFSPDDTDQLSSLMVLMSSNSVNLKKMSQASLEIIHEWGTDRFAHGLLQSLQAVYPVKNK